MKGENMTVEECYKVLEGSYDEVRSRLVSDSIIQKFAGKFLADTSYEELKKYLAEGNVEEAFRAAHTMKGVCQNLAFTKLQKSSSVLTELLRDGRLEEAKGYFDVIETDYKQTTDAIHCLIDDGQ